MTLVRYLLGLLLGGVALAPVHMSSYLWRARLTDRWTGAQARLAEIIGDLAVIICVSEILGSVHLYRLGPMVAALAGVGLAGCWGAGRRRRPRNQSGEDRESSPPLTPGPYPLGAIVAALAAVSVVVAEWSTRTVAAYHHGMLSTDTLWYHMPFAARFVQDGSITALQYVDSEPVTVFFPASSELLHSFGILLMANDVLSPALNTLWLGLALLAGWCIGRPFAMAPITLTGTAILFATPGLVSTQPGGAYDDVVGLALVLSAVAMLVNIDAMSERAARAALGTGALSAGIALGTKFTFVAPVAALTVGVWFLAPRGRRLAHAVLWLALMILTGAFWYGRNLLAVGNPLPSLRLRLGPLALPGPAVSTPTSTVAHFLFDGSAWNKYYLPGLRLSFGPAWWAMLGLAVTGLLLATARGGRQQRVLGLVGLATGVLFLFTPQYLIVLGAPVFFVDNVRYVDPALLLGLVLLPINPLVATWRRARWLLGAYCVILAVTQLDASIWPTSLFTDRFAPPIRGSDLLAGALVGVVVLGVGAAILLKRRRIPSWRMPTMAMIAACVIVLGLGYPLQQVYLRDRYVGTGGLGPVYTWAQHVHNARIAVIGTYAYLQYPLYGKDLSNYVQYLGIRGPHGSYSPFHSCTAWRQALNAGHFSYVLVTTGPVQDTSAVSAHPSSETGWTDTDPAAHVVLHRVTYLGAPFPGYLGFTLFAPPGSSQLRRLAGARHPPGTPKGSGLGPIPRTGRRVAACEEGGRTHGRRNHPVG